ncbi:hypothetical protein ZHAS_00016612 [Anopheles sinensis]|uniref:Uncharacterized protein n=1 Tax=Anopheles sinensis TaxID=74873 RepID=A0A084WEH8_ANOSI|nr:hypothetical protein ZHAS_00016612 [Anopheles sinensis]
MEDDREARAKGTKHNDGREEEGPHGSVNECLALFAVGHDSTVIVIVICTTCDLHGSVSKAKLPFRTRFVLSVAAFRRDCQYQFLRRPGEWFDKTEIPSLHTSPGAGSCAPHVCRASSLSSKAIDEGFRVHEDSGKLLEKAKRLPREFAWVAQTELGPFPGDLPSPKPPPAGVAHSSALPTRPGTER